MRELFTKDKHGIRSAVMLLELGFHLSPDEYIAIHFHMRLNGKENHPLYEDAKKNQLRYLIHKADSISASAKRGYKDPYVIEDDLQPYLCNITQLESKDIIYQVNEGWFLGIHSPYDGEIDPDWKDKIIGIQKYETAKLYPINDSFVGAIFVLKAGNKKGLFVIHHYFGMQGGAFLSPDKEPFMYSDIKVYCDREKWSNFNGNRENWSSYGYAACKQRNGWKLVKVTQFPMLNYEVVGEGFSSAEEAMKSIGINDSERYITEEI
jgi:hypothetical protein